MGNDRVSIADGAVVLNGERQYEPYVPSREQARYSLAPTTIPAGCVFVLGDNRNVSDDSHLWGPLPVENVIGKAFYILWPVERQGFVDELMTDLQITKNPSVFLERVNDVSNELSTKMGDRGQPPQPAID